MRPRCRKPTGCTVRFRPRANASQVGTKSPASEHWKENVSFHMLWSNWLFCLPDGWFTGQVSCR